MAMPCLHDPQPAKEGCKLSYHMMHSCPGRKQKGLVVQSIYDAKISWITQLLKRKTFKKMTHLLENAPFFFPLVLTLISQTLPEEIICSTMHLLLGFFACGGGCITTLFFKLFH